VKRLELETLSKIDTLSKESTLVSKDVSNLCSVHLLSTSITMQCSTGPSCSGVGPGLRGPHIGLWGMYVVAGSSSLTEMGKLSKH